MAVPIVNVAQININYIPIFIKSINIDITLKLTTMTSKLYIQIVQMPLIIHNKLPLKFVPGIG